MSNHTLTVLSGALALAMAGTAIAAAENPFTLNTLDQGYQVADAGTKTDMGSKAKEGKCSSGKCGASKKKTKEGSCSAAKMKEGACSAEKMQEGSCSAEKMKEGSCHASK